VVNDRFNNSESTPARFWRGKKRKALERPEAARQARYMLYVIRKAIPYE
jgi:hypothetical protein